MTRNVTRTTLGAVLLCSTLAGCGGLFSSKPSRFYTLDTIAATSIVAPISGLPIGVDVVELPPGADRREVVVRQADQRLEVRGREQWSASLEPLILHTLAFNLASRVPAGMIILPGQPKPAGGMHSIDVVFEEVAAGPQNLLVVNARWTLRDRTSRPVVTGQERLETRLQSLDSANIATGLSEALAALSDRIAARLPVS